MSFYNSNKERGATLAKSRKKAANQDERILQVFRNSGIPWSAWDMFKLLERKENYPLTSVRRSINTLVNAGKINELNFMRIGGYGKPNRVYKYNPKAK